MKDFAWTIIGSFMGGIFTILALIFLLLKDKACILISGYNFKSKEEREKYDEELLSSDERNFFFICAAIFWIGAVGALFIGAASFWISFVIWFIYFLRNFHLDSEKAFGKYRKEK